MDRREKAGLAIIAIIKACAYILIYFASQIVIGLVLGIIFAFTDPDGATDLLLSKSMELTILANMISVVLCIWLTRKMYDEGAYQGFKLNLDMANKGKVLAVCVALGVFGQYVVTYIINSLESKLPVSWVDALEENTKLMQQSNYVTMFIAIAIVAPLAEEIIFRACVQSALHKGITRWPAIIASSLVFGLMHGNPIGIIYATLLGFFMGWLFSQFDSIFPSMIFHLAFNLTSVLLTKLSTAFFVISCVCFALCLAYIIYLGIYHKKHPLPVQDDTDLSGTDINNKGDNDNNETL